MAIISRFGRPGPSSIAGAGRRLGARRALICATFDEMDRQRRKPGARAPRAQRTWCCTLHDAELCRCARGEKKKKKKKNLAIQVRDGQGGRGMEMLARTSIGGIG